MSIAYPGPVMAKRNDVSVRIDADVLRKSRVLAALEDKSIAEFISETLRPLVDKRYAEAMAREAKESEQPKKR